jgi:hypothetical protein
VGHLATLEGHKDLVQLCDELDQVAHVLTWYHACHWSHVMGLLSVRQVRGPCVSHGRGLGVGQGGW